MARAKSANKSRKPVQDDPGNPLGIDWAKEQAKADAAAAKKAKGKK